MSVSHNNQAFASKAIRTAQLADLDDVVEVVRTTMPTDPQWDWRFEYRQEYPEDNEKYTKLLFQHFIDPTYDDWHVMVAEAPSLEDPSVMKITAFAVWDVSYKNLRKHGQQYEPQNPMLAVARNGGSARRDANPKRQAAFREAATRGKQKYFDDVYGHDQIHLQILGTHPDYMRRGFGSSLVKWGISVAQEDRVVVTLMASEMGKLLYSQLGFKYLGQFFTEAPEEAEQVDFVVMVLELGKDEYEKFEH